MGGSRDGAPESRKFFKKFDEIRKLKKLKIWSIIKSFMNFCADLGKNIRIIENSLLPEGSGCGKNLNFFQNNRIISMRFKKYLMLNDNLMQPP